MASGMPLAFTQEDFLVYNLFYNSVEFLQNFIRKTRLGLRDR